MSTQEVIASKECPEDSDAVFAVEWVDGRRVGVVTACGEVDLSNVPDLRATLEQALEADEGIVVDLSGVTYVDSSGFGALLEASRGARPLGLDIYLAGCNSNVLRMLEITRLNSMFRVVPTREDALMALNAAAPATASAA